MIEGLPPELQAFVQAQVAAGNYPSETDVVVSGVRLLRAEQDNYERFRAEVKRRIKSLDAGNYIELNGDEELDRFFDELLDEATRKLPAERHTSNEPVSS
jgi:putative addiction module CopG family antidote